MSADNGNKGAEQSAPFSSDEAEPERIVGVNKDGVPVDNITDANRDELRASQSKWRKAHLLTENGKELAAEVYFRNTRQPPAALIFEGVAYGLLDTRPEIAQYQAVYTATAVREPQTEG